MSGSTGANLVRTHQYRALLEPSESSGRDPNPMLRAAQGAANVVAFAQPTKGNYGYLADVWNILWFGRSDALAFPHI